ncbi:MAG: mechanosensitive ion channel family protein [Ignavibacteriaceae bacterium]|nr:mechanosensitive ion channel family protein [Ignavibacteriaceae bacterium]
MQDFLNNIQEWLREYPVIYYNLKFIGVFGLAVVSYFVVKYVINKVVRKITSKTKTEFDDLLLNRKLIKRIALIAPIFVLNRFSHLLPQFENVIEILSAILMVLMIILTIGAILTSYNDVYEQLGKSADRPIKGYLQVTRIFTYFFGVIFIIGIVTEQNVWNLFAGLAAASALVLLIFRDTILSFVASVQINSYDLIRKGDWIEMKKFGADGDVIDISLNVIKIQNWDKTIVVIPTYKLLEESFINWRGMQMTGSRRIKRSILIDVNSVKFCDEDMLERFKKYQLISDYIKEKIKDLKKFNLDQDIDESQVINGRRLTNLGTFRIYLENYLKKRQDVNKGLTFMVRHLDPGPTGIPIEVYVFATTTEWVKYEGIQADIFDHIFAVVTLFDLKVFQTPSGSDFRYLKN